MKRFIFIIVFLFIETVFSQVGVNTTNPQAMLDIEVSDRDNPLPTDGLLIPRLNNFPSINPSASQNGMLIFLTTTVGTNPSGFYFWNNTLASWMLIDKKDKDFLKVGTINEAATDITDDIYTLGNMVIGENSSPNGVLDIKSTNKGVLLPRVELTSTIISAPVINPSGGNLELGTFVYNTATSAPGANQVIPGFYYWNDRWIRLDDEYRGKPRYYVVNGTTNASCPTTMTLMPEMNIELTPMSNVVLVNFSAGGFDENGQNAIFFDIFQDGVLIKGFQTTTEDINNVANRPIWDINILYPIAVTPYVATSISIRWGKPSGNRPSNFVEAIPNPFTFNAHRVLTIIDPQTLNGFEAEANPPINSYWSTNGNIGTNPATNFLGTLDNVGFNIVTNNQNRFNFSTGGHLRAYATGTSSNPVYSWQNNTNTGMFSPNFNTLAFSTNGQERLRINNLGFVGIGTDDPLDRLHVNGSIRMVDGNQGAGRFMVSNVNGTGSWQTVTTANSWSTLGNNITSVATQFIGTTNNFDVIFRRNNVRAGRLGITNTSFGVNALNPNSTGNFNSAFGVGSLQNNDTGFENSAFGYEALRDNTTGYYNAAFGRASLLINTEGFNNSAYAYQSLRNNTIGNDNTALGRLALFNNSEGNQNTAVGRSALSANTTGSSNTALGFNAFSSGTNYSNSTALGANTVITASNQIRLGSNTVTSIGGFVGFTNLSDGRFKKNIKNNVPGLDFIKKLKPVTYQLDMNKLSNFMRVHDSVRNFKLENTKSNIIYTGFLAQQVEEAANDLNFDFSGIDKPKNQDDYYGLRYAEFVVPLVKAVQEQQDMIDKNDILIDELSRTLAIINDELDKLKQKVQNEK